MKRLKNRKPRGAIRRRKDRDFFKFRLFYEYARKMAIREMIMAESPLAAPRTGVDGG